VRMVRKNDVVTSLTRAESCAMAGQVLPAHELGDRWPHDAQRSASVLVYRFARQHLRMLVGYLRVPNAQGRTREIGLRPV
jgi:hypothetical protein